MVNIAIDDHNVCALPTIHDHLCALQIIDGSIDDKSTEVCASTPSQIVQRGQLPLNRVPHRQTPANAATYPAR